MTTPVTPVRVLVAGAGHDKGEGWILPRVGFWAIDSRGRPFVLNEYEIAQALRWSGPGLDYDLARDEIADRVVTGVRENGLAQLRENTRRAALLNGRRIQNAATADELREFRFLWPPGLERMCSKLADRLVAAVQRDHWRTTGRIRADARAALAALDTAA